jgi:hypothetical protein
MHAQCPHCGTRLPVVADAFCPECRRPLGETPAKRPAIVSAEAITRQPPARGVDRERVSSDAIEFLEKRIAHLEWRLRHTNLHSEGFLTRAFTVWGHFMVAHLIIVFPLFALAMCAGFMSR